MNPCSDFMGTNHPSARKKCIVIVDDDEIAMQLIHDYLIHHNYEVLMAPDEDCCDEYLNTREVDLILMDIQLGTTNGLYYVANLRKKGIGIPIIFLTVHYGIEEQALGFKLGCEDYIKKPVDLNELLLRIKRVFGDFGTGVGEFHKIGLYAFNPVTYCLVCKGVSCQLSHLEGSVLKELMAECGKVVTKSLLIEKYWQSYDTYTSRNVDSIIVKLRKRFKEDPSIRIVSVKKLGYKLVKV